MTNNTSRSAQLLDKVYDHLDTIDVSELSLNELKDFLEVVQKGQFLESYGSMHGYISSNPYSGYGCDFNGCDFNGFNYPANNSEAEE